jgi:transposase
MENYTNCLSILITVINPPLNAKSDHTDLSLPRLVLADRQQPYPHFTCFDDLLEEEHLARQVWELVDTMDFSPLYQKIRARQGHAGRPSFDPKILMALWLYGILDGIYSARALEEQVLRHQVYQWLAAGHAINYHTLSDFRTHHTQWLDQTLTESVAVMLHQGMISMNTIAQDGMRIRASAGQSSFRREQTLQQCCEQATQYLEQLQQEEGSSGQGSRRRQAARQRAAEERKQRLKQAQKELEQLQAQRQQSECKTQREKVSRASTTDPQARVMKMANGGFCPAYNAQFAVDAEHGVILGVEASQEGSDSQEMVPMLNQLQERYATVPEAAVVDGGYSTLKQLEAVAKAYPEVTVYGPVKNAKKKLEQGDNPYQKQARDSKVVGAWRERMGTTLAQARMRRRGSTVEWANARARACGLGQLMVRGVEKVRSVLTLFALAHNLSIALRLRAAEM